MAKNMYNLGDLLKYIKYPLITEKSVNLYDNRQYTFIVDKSLTKTKLKFIIEKIFNVNVIGVNTSILPTKTRRVGKFVGKKALYKKAFVKLKIGQTISDLIN